MCAPVRLHTKVKSPQDKAAWSAKVTMHACQPACLLACFSFFLTNMLREGKPGGFPFFSGKVMIVSQTLSGMLLVCACILIFNKPRKRKKDQSRKSSKEWGKSWRSRDPNWTKKGRTSPNWETPLFETPLVYQPLNTRSSAPLFPYMLAFSVLSGIANGGGSRREGFLQ